MKGKMGIVSSDRLPTRANSDFDQPNSLRKCGAMMLVVYIVREKPEPSPINAAVKGRHCARNSEK